MFYKKIDVWFEYYKVLANFRIFASFFTRIQVRRKYHKTSIFFINLTPYFCIKLLSVCTKLSPFSLIYVWHKISIVLMLKIPTYLFALNSTYLFFKFIYFWHQILFFFETFLQQTASKTTVFGIMTATTLK